MSPWRCSSLDAAAHERSLKRTSRNGMRWGESRTAAIGGALLGTLLVCACGSPSQVNSASLPQPQPIAVGQHFESPSLVWRTVPLAHASARQTVVRFFDSVARESGPELESLFAEDALFHRPTQPSTPAALAWLRRLSAGDYTKQPIPADVQVQLLDHTSATKLASHRTVHLRPQAGELIAVVALPTAQNQTAALWGTELELVLTPRDGAWQIRELWEDFPTR